MSSTSLDLARLTFDAEEAYTTVIGNADIPDLRIDRIQIRLMKDKETEVPLWVAQVLEEQNIASIKVDHTVSHGYVARLAHAEGEKRVLESLPDSFLYRRLKTYMSQLRNINTATSLRRLTSIEGNFNKLLRLRFNKILNMAMLDNQLDGNIDLAEEEKWLYMRLNEIFATWQNNAGLGSEEMS